MKKQYIILLLFYWVFHFIVPWIYFRFYGFVNLYSTVQGYEGMIINTIAILGTVLVIAFLPSTKKTIKPEWEHADSFFLIALFITLVKFIIGGGFQGALSGASQGSFISYLSQFFNLNTAFILMFCLQKNIRHVYLLLASFILVATFTGSRSSVVFLLIVAIFLPVFYNYALIKKKLIRIIIFIALISPVIFLYGTSLRGNFDRDKLVKLIFGRISMIELSMIPLQGKADGTMRNDIFDEKYSATNQFQQVLNTVSPIDPYKYDIAPNQYFRQIFLRASEKYVRNSYMSMNFTLPVYFVMKTNLFLGCLMTILLLSLIYYLWHRFSSNIYIFISIICSLYNLLYFFDWIIIAQIVFTTCLTILALKMYNHFANSIGYTLTRYSRLQIPELIDHGKTF